MHQQYVLPFVAGWAALGIGGAVLLGQLRSPPVKRIVWRVLTGLAGVIFLAAVWLLDGSIKNLLFMAPPVLLILLLNVWLVRVCDSCAALVQPRYLVPSNFCPKCGAPFR
jgi:hypothetical protein